MNDVTDIDGSYFTGANESPHLWRSLTPDKRFLLVVTKSVGKLFRAHVFHRISGAPQWTGTWWAEIDHPSLTDSEASAQQLAQEKLQAFLTSHST